MNAAQGIESAHLYPPRIKFSHRRIILYISAITGNVTSSKRNNSQTGRQQYRNLIGHLSPALRHVITVSTVTGPAEGIALQARKSGTCHLKYATVRIPFFKLLLHHLIPRKTINIVNLIMHAQMVFHHQAFRLLLIAPGRFTHISPETGNAIINGLLLISSPPVCHSRKGEVHYATITTPEA